MYLDYVLVYIHRWKSSSAREVPRWRVYIRRVPPYLCTYVQVVYLLHSAITYVHIRM